MVDLKCFFCAMIAAVNVTAATAQTPTMTNADSVVVSEQEPAYLFRLRLFH